MENEKRIKVLASDVGGVMAYFKTGYTSKTLRDFAEALEFHSGCPVNIWQPLLTIEPGTFEHDFIAGNITPKEFYWKMRQIASIYAKGKSPFPSFQLFKAIWCNIFLPNYELLKELRNLSRVYKVVLASNIDIWHYPLLGKMCDWNNFVSPGGVASCFDHLIKPDEAFFELLIKRSGVLPSEIFFFDDTPENIKVASECGITVHLFENNKGLFDAFEKNGIVHLMKTAE